MFSNFADDNLTLFTRCFRCRMLVALEALITLNVVASMTATVSMDQIFELLSLPFYMWGCRTCFVRCYFCHVFRILFDTRLKWLGGTVVDFTHLDCFDRSSGIFRLALRSVRHLCIWSFYGKSHKCSWHQVFLVVSWVWDFIVRTWVQEALKYTHALEHDHQFEINCYYPFTTPYFSHMFMIFRIFTPFWEDPSPSTPRACLGFGRFCADVGVVVVPREDEAPEPERPPQVFVAQAAPGDVAGFSSTKIRGAAADSPGASRNGEPLMSSSIEIGDVPNYKAPFIGDFLLPCFYPLVFEIG